MRLKTITLTAVAVLLATALPATPVAADPELCPTDPTAVSLGGALWVRTDQNGIEWYYLEDNEVPGLQWGSPSPIFGWSELNECLEGDTLLY